MTDFQYKEIIKIGPYRIVQHPATNFFYASWYDADARQTRRRSLRCRDIEFACAVVRSLVERGITGDPGDALAARPLRTVSELLDWHLPYVEGLVSADAEKHQIDRLKRLLGEARINLLVPADLKLDHLIGLRVARRGPTAP